MNGFLFNLADSSTYLPDWIDEISVKNYIEMIKGIFFLI